jgi:hypothetical protein
MRFNAHVVAEVQPSLVYLLRHRLADGTERDGRLTTRRHRRVDDLVNSPCKAGGNGAPGKGYLWLIASVEEAEDPLVEAVLVLDFKGPHTEMQEPRA